MENLDNQIDDPVEEPMVSQARSPFSEADHNRMSQACLYLISISKWMKFFFVLMIISITFTVLCGLFFIVGGPIFNDVPDMPNFPIAIAGVIYMAAGALNLVPAIYMNRISKAAELTAESNDNDAMLDFLKNNKSLWKFLGIVVIVMMGLGIVAFPVAFMLTSLL